jgi:Xaa-Pro dipeptidase
VEAQLAKIRRLLDDLRLDGIILTQEVNVAWLFGGRYHINVATEVACASVFITKQRVAALVNNIEAERLADEEGLFADEVHVHSWHDDAQRDIRLQEWLMQPGIRVDTQLQLELKRLRTVLEEDRAGEVRVFGRLLAEAVEETCKYAQPGQTERELAAKLAGACLSRGIEPIVNLVGNEHRSQRYRHLLPTDEPINAYAIVSVGGRRGGLVLSVTRMFHFGTVPAVLLEKYRSVLRVEAAMLAASQQGTTAGAAFQRALAQYESEGYENEWQLHHQGGVAGYQSREIRATATSDWVLQPNMLVAWNPTIQGVKAEETCLVTKDGVEILTRTPSFPLMTVTVNGIEMALPDILVL